MGILDALNQVKQEKFDPSEGKTGSGFEKIPAGTYNVSLSEVCHGVWENSGTDYVRFTMMVLDGDEAGREEFITPTLASMTSKGKEMPQFVLATSIKTVKVIGQMAGFVVPDSVFKENETESYEAIQEAFQPYIGKVMQMTIKESKNKNDPDNPYRNYSFAKLEQPKKADAKKDPFAGTGDTVDISDDDLPF